MARKMLSPGKGRSSSTPSPQPNPQPKPAPRAPRNMRAPIQKAPAQRQMGPAIQQRGGGGRQAGGPITQQSSFMGGGDPGGGLMNAMSAGAAPAVTAPSEEDYLAGDGSFQAQLAALKGALERYTADSTLQRNNYQTDYGSSLRDLGYTEGAEGGAGQWNWNDQNTASGRAYQNQLNDFASRNMLQSQGYADAATDLERQLGQQYTQMSTNKTNFMTDLDRQLANYKGENTSGVNAARAEAIARRAAQYAL